MLVKDDILRRKLLDKGETVEQGVRIRLREWKTVVNTLKED